MNDTTSMPELNSAEITQLTPKVQKLIKNWIELEKQLGEIDIDKIFDTLNNNAEKTTKQPTLIVGNEYTYSNKSGKDKLVKVLSLDTQIDSGIDKKYSTSDDIEKSALASGYVFVQFKNNNGSYDKDSQTMAVDINSLNKMKEGISSFIVNKFGYTPPEAGTSTTVGRANLTGPGTENLKTPGEKLIGFTQIQFYETLKKFKSVAKLKSISTISKFLIPGPYKGRAQTINNITEPFYTYKIKQKNFVSSKIDLNNFTLGGMAGTPKNLTPETPEEKDDDLKNEVVVANTNIVKPQIATDPPPTNALEVISIYNNKNINSNFYAQGYEFLALAKNVSARKLGSFIPLELSNLWRATASLFNSGLDIYFYMTKMRKYTRPIGEQFQTSNIRNTMSNKIILSNSIKQMIQEELKTYDKVQFKNIKKNDAPAKVAKERLATEIEVDDKKTKFLEAITYFVKEYNHNKLSDEVLSEKLVELGKHVKAKKDVIEVNISNWKKRPTTNAYEVAQLFQDCGSGDYVEKVEDPEKAKKVKEATLPKANVKDTLSASEAAPNKPKGVKMMKAK